MDLLMNSLSLHLFGDVSFAFFFQRMCLLLWNAGIFFQRFKDVTLLVSVVTVEKLAVSLTAALEIIVWVSLYLHARDRWLRQVTVFVGLGSTPLLTSHSLESSSDCSQFFCGPSFLAHPEHHCWHLNPLRLPEAPIFFNLLATSQPSALNDKIGSHLKAKTTKYKVLFSDLFQGFCFLNFSLTWHPLYLLCHPHPSPGKLMKPCFLVDPSPTMPDFNFGSYLLWQLSSLFISWMIDVFYPAFLIMLSRSVHLLWAIPLYLEIDVP